MYDHFAILCEVRRQENLCKKQVWSPWGVEGEGDSCPVDFLSVCMADQDGQRVANTGTGGRETGS